MATRRGGGKKSAENRQGVKNSRRVKRSGKPEGRPWHRRKPRHKQGMGGTDKGWRGGRKLGKPPTYSDAPASREHGKAFRKPKK